MIRTLSLFGVTFALLAAPLHGHAFDIPPNDGFVTDAASVLTEAQADTLESMLFRYQQETTNEIAVLIVPSLEGEPIEQVAVDVGRRWGVGSEKDNGILILIDYSGRELFLATGYGLEGAIPDIVARGIINTDIIPHFREGQYYEGILAGVEAIQKHIGGEYQAERYAYASQSAGIVPFLILVLFLFSEWFIAVLARSKSWWLGGVLGFLGGVFLAIRYHWWLSIPFLTIAGLLLDYIVSSNYKGRGPTRWWAGGDFSGTRSRVRPRGTIGGGGGRRGGGFGGGSFGGGGARGKW